MRREQSLTHKARCAERYLGFPGDLEDEVTSTGWGAINRDVRPMEIHRTLTSTTASSASLSAHNVLSAWLQRGKSHAKHYGQPVVRWVGVKEFAISSAYTDSRKDELVGYERVPVFDELQTLRADEAPFRIVLRQLEAQTAIRARESIAERLEGLLEDFQEDCSRSLNPESLRTFLTLLIQHPDLKRPSITAADSGNLVVEWKSEDKMRFLGLQMLPMHQVRFVAYSPDARNPHFKKHSSGVTSVDQLFVDLASYDVLSWARLA